MHHRHLTLCTTNIVRHLKIRTTITTAQFLYQLHNCITPACITTTSTVHHALHEFCAKFCPHPTPMPNLTQIVVYTSKICNFHCECECQHVMHTIDYYHHCTLIYTHGAMGCMNLCAAASVNTLINLNCAATASHRCCCPNTLTGM